MFTAKSEFAARDDGIVRVKSAVEIPLAHPTRCRRASGGLQLHRRSQQRLPGLRHEDRRGSLRFNTGGSIGGGVVTYTYYSKQYVATPLGTVSAFFWRVGTAGNCCLRTSLGAAHDAWVKSLAQQGAQL